MTEQKALHMWLMENERRIYLEGGSLVEEAWKAALEWAGHGQEPVGWISYDERFMPHKDRTEAPVEILEQFQLPVYDHPDPPSRLSKDECRDIFLAKGFTIKEGEKDLKPYVFEAADAMMDAMLSKSSQHPAPPQDVAELVEALREIEGLAKAGDVDAVWLAAVRAQQKWEGKE